MPLRSLGAAPSYFLCGVFLNLKDKRWEKETKRGDDMRSAAFRQMGPTKETTRDASQTVTVCLSFFPLLPCAARSVLALTVLGALLVCDTHSQLN